MNAIHKALHRSIACALLCAPPVFGQDVDEAPIGEEVECHLGDDHFAQRVQDPERIASEEGDQLEVRETETDGPETIKVAQQVVDVVLTVDFGAKEGIVAMTIIYPIDFLPAA